MSRKIDGRKQYGVRCDAFEAAFIARIARVERRTETAVAHLLIKEAMEARMGKAAVPADASRRQEEEKTA